MDKLNQDENSAGFREDNENGSPWKTLSKKKILQLAIIGFIGIVVLFTQIFEIKISIKPRFAFLRDQTANIPESGQSEINIETAVLPAEGVVLPVKWGSFGARMIASGVIDKNQFESLYVKRGGLNEYERSLLYGDNNDNIKMTSQNAGVILNLLWAFGLANKNPILEKGPMQDARYGGAGRFASTGGWTLSKGEAMTHYSAHTFIVLSPEQQALVEKVSKNIYRSCCGNSTYFPDCNHGMAMLALLELMAWQGASEEEMYKTALEVNSYWFPDTYLTIAKYFEKRGVAWAEVDPKTVLGSAYSSASGYRGILSEVEPTEKQGGGGCGT